MRRSLAPSLLLLLFAHLVLLPVGCGGGGKGSTTAAGASITTSSTSSGTTTGTRGGLATGSGGSGGAGPIAPEILPITDQHRFIAGKMFGGWGPHLGHLVRANASQGAGRSLWFVDDVCSQMAGAADACDVNHDLAIGYFEETTTGWQLSATVPLPGTVQQNTATIVSPAGDEFSTFGVDIAGHLIQECKYAPASGPLGCAPLPFTLGVDANYIGAAISPTGARMVWWTDVVDGGGGSFEYVVDYGGGWNGPRAGSAGGYNDASYINIAFGAGSNQGRFTMHVQLVSGLAPNWTFLGAVGSGDLGTTDPVSWQNVLAPPSGDTVESKNDIWIDPATDDTHLVARTYGGAAVYYHRPAGGAFSGPLFTLPGAYRARFLAPDSRLVLLYGPSQGGLAYRVAGKNDRPAGSPIAWSTLLESTIALPSGFGEVMAIYPESPAYQTIPAQGIRAAVVGEATQNSVLSVGLP
jgi:hypothetical protein